jgi:hypothetical protein
MYATCIHCAKSLGSNESIEALPIGRRIAFDAKRGRLWVVCRSCERWNLTPFETRWEAIEQGEKAFRDTRVRVSTDNIGLARLRDGTELVRIGEPQRPEFAAWRYGDQFGRRRRKAIAVGAGAAAGIGVAAAGAVTLGVGVAAIIPVFQIANLFAVLRHFKVNQHRFGLPDGRWFLPIGVPRLIPGRSESDWGIEIGYTLLRDAGDDRGAPLASWNGEGKNEIGRVQLYGTDAVPLLRRYLPGINKAGASASVIQQGVALIEEAGGSERFGAWAAAQRRAWAARQVQGDTGDLQYLPAPARLAFEMAVFEDAERAALEGELAALERAWAEAEGVAAIADGLAVPASVTTKLETLKDHRRSS